MAGEGATEAPSDRAERTAMEGHVADAGDDEGPVKPVVPGYDLVRVLGRGGMGIVWEAIEHRLDRHVALKVRAPASEIGTEHSEMAALWSEARLAAKVADPGVVPVHDVGHTLDGLAYYTMELVGGTDLAAVIKDGPIPQARAARIAAEIARAVAAAHQAGIIHRDLKPRNVMIDPGGRARVLDFGLAMRVTPTSDLGGAFAGSPPYMAPEQIEGGHVGPPADVHAIGVILYEMLTGKRPFEGQQRVQLLYRILHELPAPPSAVVAVHADLERVLMRCFQKKPTDRYATARPLANALTAIVEGRTLAEGSSPSVGGYEPRVARITSNPGLKKPAISEATRTFKWHWALRSSPSALWPFVSDTDRFNEMAGLGTVHVEQARESPETTARTAHAQAAGFSMTWREYPFEWIKERQHSVFRWYSAGPLEALWNRVELTPRPDGGTDLAHEIAVVPRGMLGRVAMLVEIGQRLRRAIHRTYLELDEALVAGRSDPWSPPHHPDETQRARIAAGARALVERGFSEAAVQRLVDALLTTPTRDIARMRPNVLARTWDMPHELALDLMLHGAQVGLLDLSWDLVCPTCMIAHESVGSLEQITPAGHCDACEIDYERDLGASVELVFRPHPEARQTKAETYCAGSPARKPHVFAQIVMDPGESRTVSVPLAMGDYLVSSVGVAHSGELVSSPMGHTGSAEAIVRDGAIDVLPRVAAEGAVEIRLVNDTLVERAVRIEAKSSRRDSVPAARALTHPTFRDFFSRELFAHGELLRVSHLAFIAVDGADRGALFASRSDAEACAAVRSIEDAFVRAVRSEQGTPLPGPLDTFLAAFPSPVRALRAALSVLRDSKDGPVRVALHGGRCLALTRDAHIEYFGETVHRALWLVMAASLHELVVTQSTADDPDVARALAAEGISTRVEVAQSGPYKGRRVVIVTQRAKELDKAG